MSESGNRQGPWAVACRCNGLRKVFSQVPGHGEMSQQCILVWYKPHQVCSKINIGILLHFEYVNVPPIRNSQHRQWDPSILDDHLIIGLQPGKGSSTSIGSCRQLGSPKPLGAIVLTLVSLVASLSLSLLFHVSFPRS